MYTKMHVRSHYITPPPEMKPRAVAEERQTEKRSWKGKERVSEEYKAERRERKIHCTKRKTVQREKICAACGIPLYDTWTQGPKQGRKCRKEKEETCVTEVEERVRGSPEKESREKNKGKRTRDRGGRILILSEAAAG